MEEIYYRGEQLPKFDCNKGVGETYENNGIDGGDKKVFYAIAETPRKVTLRITSWIGISNGIHYYGSLNVSDLYFHENKDAKRGNCMFGGACKTPPNTHGFKIELRRILIQEEIDKDPIRFKYCRANEWTGRFNTKKEVKALAKKIFEESFGEGWKLIIEDKS